MELNCTQIFTQNYTSILKFELTDSNKTCMLHDTLSQEKRKKNVLLVQRQPQIIVDY
jgi:hypothetical protein